MSADLDALASALLDGIRAARRPGCPAWEALDRDMRATMDLAEIAYASGTRPIARVDLAGLRAAWRELAQAMERDQWERVEWTDGQRARHRAEVRRHAVSRSISVVSIDLEVLDDARADEVLGAGR